MPRHTSTARHPLQQGVITASGFANTQAELDRLDSATGKQIFALFRQLVDEQGITVIVATHNPDIIEYATQIHELRDGRLS